MSAVPEIRGAIVDAVKLLFAQSSELGPAGSGNLYAIVDASRDPMIVPTLQALASEAASLYSGAARDESGDNGPWLVHLKPHEGTLDWLLDTGFGKRWCCFIVSGETLPGLRLHLKKFVKIYLPDGSSMFFRFFDPQVMAGYVRVLSLDQRLRFFEALSQIGFELGDQGFMTIRLEPDGRFSWHLVQGNGEGGIAAVDGFAALPSIDLSRSAARPNFAFTQEQLDLPILLNRAWLIEELIDYLDDNFRARMNLYPAGMLRMMIDWGIHLATVTYKITDLTHIKLFVGLMWRIAPGFHKQPKINAVLLKTHLPAVERFDRVLEESFQQAWADATLLNDSSEWHPFGSPEPMTGED